MMREPTVKEVGELLDKTLREIAARRKTAANTGPFEDIFWPYPLWITLWNDLKQRGGHSLDPDSTKPIIVKTTLFTLRVHIEGGAQPRLVH